MNGTGRDHSVCFLILLDFWPLPVLIQPHAYIPIPTVQLPPCSLFIKSVLTLLSYLHIAYLIRIERTLHI